MAKDKLEELKAAIAKADTMAKLVALLAELDAPTRNKLTHQVYAATNRIVLGEAA